jgi:predicted Fe-Mo cluster-binding NifX family protein
MRIAVPIWEDRVSPVLDTASRLLIIELEDQREASRFETLLDEQDIYRRCVRIKRLGIDILICGAISCPFLRMLMVSGIKIIYGISGNTEDVLEAYFCGAINHTKFLMPGFRRNRFCEGSQAPALKKRRFRQGQKLGKQNS